MSDDTALGHCTACYACTMVWNYPSVIPVANHTFRFSLIIHTMVLNTAYI